MKEINEVDEQVEAYLAEFEDDLLEEISDDVHKVLEQFRHGLCNADELEDELFDVISEAVSLTFEELRAEICGEDSIYE